MAVRSIKELFGSCRECRHPAKAIFQGFRECAVGRLQQDIRNTPKEIIAAGEDPVIPDGVDAVFGHRFRCQGRSPSAQPTGYHVIGEFGDYLARIHKTIPFRSGNNAPVLQEPSQRNHVMGHHRTRGDDQTVIRLEDTALVRAIGGDDNIYSFYAGALNIKTNV